MQQNGLLYTGKKIQQIKVDKDMQASYVKRVQLADIGTSLVCGLCKGYLIDATTITECLHSYCRSCLLRYLQSHDVCPKCHIKVCKQRWTTSFRDDSLLQELVYKLVPGLFQREMQTRLQFAKSQQWDDSPEQNDIGSKDETCKSTDNQLDKDLENGNQAHTTENQAKVTAVDKLNKSVVNGTDIANKTDGSENQTDQSADTENQDNKQLVNGENTSGTQPDTHSCDSTVGSQSQANGLVTQEPVSVVTQEPVSVVTREPVSVVTREPLSLVTQGPVSVCLKLCVKNPCLGLHSYESADRRYLRCPGAITIKLIKKFIRLKFELPIHHQIQCYYGHHRLEDSFTLSDVTLLYGWTQMAPLEISYTVFDQLTSFLGKPRSAREGIKALFPNKPKEGPPGAEQDGVISGSSHTDVLDSSFPNVDNKGSLSLDSQHAAVDSYSLSNSSCVTPEKAITPFTNVDSPEYKITSLSNISCSTSHYPESQCAPKIVIKCKKRGRPRKLESSMDHEDKKAKMAMLKLGDNGKMKLIISSTGINSQKRKSMDADGRSYQVSTLPKKLPKLLPKQKPAAKHGVDLQTAKQSCMIKPKPTSSPENCKSDINKVMDNIRLSAGVCVTYNQQPLTVNTTSYSDIKAVPFTTHTTHLLTTNATSYNCTYANNQSGAALNSISSPRIHQPNDIKQTVNIPVIYEPTCNITNKGEKNKHIQMCSPNKIKTDVTKTLFEKLIDEFSPKKKDDVGSALMGGEGVTLKGSLVVEKTRGNTVGEVKDGVEQGRKGVNESNNKGDNLLKVVNNRKKWFEGKREDNVNNKGMHGSVVKNLEGKLKKKCDHTLTRQTSDDNDIDNIGVFNVSHATKDTKESSEKTVIGEVINSNVKVLTTVISVNAINNTDTQPQSCDNTIAIETPLKQRGDMAIDPASINTDMKPLDNSRPGGDNEGTTATNPIKPLKINVRWDRKEGIYVRKDQSSVSHTGSSLDQGGDGEIKGFILNKRQSGAEIWRHNTTEEGSDSDGSCTTDDEALVIDETPSDDNNTTDITSQSICQSSSSPPLPVQEHETNDDITSNCLFTETSSTLHVSDNTEEINPGISLIKNDKLLLSSMHDKESHSFTHEDESLVNINDFIIENHPVDLNTVGEDNDTCQNTVQGNNTCQNTVQDSNCNINKQTTSNSGQSLHHNTSNTARLKLTQPLSCETDSPPHAKIKRIIEPGSHGGHSNLKVVFSLIPKPPKVGGKISPRVIPKSAVCTYDTPRVIPKSAVCTYDTPKAIPKSGKPRTCLSKEHRFQEHFKLSDKNKSTDVTTRDSEGVNSSIGVAMDTTTMTSNVTKVNTKTVVMESDENNGDHTDVTLTPSHNGDQTEVTPSHHGDQHGDQTEVTPSHNGDQTEVTPSHHGDQTEVTPSHNGDHTVVTPSHNGDHTVVTPSHNGDQTEVTPSHNGDHTVVTPSHNGDQTEVTPSHHGDQTVVTPSHNGDHTVVTLSHNGGQTEVTTHHHGDQTVVTPRDNHNDNVTPTHTQDNITPSKTDLRVLSSDTHNVDVISKPTSSMSDVSTTLNNIDTTVALTTRIDNISTTSHTSHVRSFLMPSCPSVAVTPLSKCLSPRIPTVITPIEKTPDSNIPTPAESSSRSTSTYVCSISSQNHVNSVKPAKPVTDTMDRTNVKCNNAMENEKLNTNSKSLDNVNKQDNMYSMYSPDVSSSSSRSPSRMSQTSNVSSAVTLVTNSTISSPIATVTKPHGLDGQSENRLNTSDHVFVVPKVSVKDSEGHSKEEGSSTSHMKSHAKGKSDINANSKFSVKPDMRQSKDKVVIKQEKFDKMDKLQTQKQPSLFHVVKSEKHAVKSEKPDLLPTIPRPLSVSHINHPSDLCKQSTFSRSPLPSPVPAIIPSPAFFTGSYFPLTPPYASPYLHPMLPILPLHSLDRSPDDLYFSRSPMYDRSHVHDFYESLCNPRAGNLMYHGLPTPETPLACRLDAPLDYSKQRSVGQTSQKSAGNKLLSGAHSSSRTNDKTSDKNGKSKEMKVKPVSTATK